MNIDDQSFEFFLLYLEQVFSREVLCADECHNRVQSLIKEDTDHILDLYLNYLYQQDEMLS